MLRKLCLFGFAAITLGVAHPAFADVEKPGVADKQQDDVIGTANPADVESFLAELKARADSAPDKATADAIITNTTSCRDFMMVMVDDMGRGKEFTHDANATLEKHTSQLLLVLQPYLPRVGDGSVAPRAYNFLTAQISRYCIAHPQSRVENATVFASNSFKRVVKDVMASREKKEDRAPDDDASDVLAVPSGHGE